jgi:hypothetical protein
VIIKHHLSYSFSNTGYKSFRNNEVKKHLVVINYFSGTASWAMFNVRMFPKRDYYFIFGNPSRRITAMNT